MKKQKKSPSKKKTSKQKAPILASTSIEGKVYLTKLGILVLVKKITVNGVQVIPEFANKILVVKKDSLLFSIGKRKVSKKTKIHFQAHLKRWREDLKRNVIDVNIEKPSALALPQNSITLRAVDQDLAEPLSAKQPKRGPKGPRRLSVGGVVDPMLFAGIYTRPQMSEILRESEIGKTLSNPDLGWYIGYRIAVLKERGYTHEQSEDGVVKIFKQIIQRMPLSEILSAIQTAPIKING